MTSWVKKGFAENSRLGAAESGSTMRLMTR